MKWWWVRASLLGIAAAAFWYWVHPSVVTFLSAVAVVTIVALARYCVFGVPGLFPSLRLPEAVGGAARWRVSLAAIAFCFGLPVLLSVLVTPSGSHGALTALFGADHGIVSFSWSNWPYPLLLLCLVAIPQLLIAVPASLRVKGLAWREDSLVPGWLAGFAAVVAAGYLFVLHFLGDLLPKSGLGTLFVAAFGVAVVVAPFFKTVANSCWRGGVMVVLDPALWWSQWLIASKEMTAKPATQLQHVRVPGRDDIGDLIDEGKNFGTNPSIYCVGIHFPSTGECTYYDKSKIEYVD